ncbi:hypothetical protein GGR51DRAFT_533857 [Nemania sp. FL0031]|nr:hypothetical protein GGR51DRAFT_533857 [Nemania sp. FL0031]
MEDSVEARPFRAVIVGGGLLGLMAAHIFAKTEMDYVILEQHDDLMPEIGSLLNLNPPTFRVLDQLDALDAVKPVLNGFDRNVLMSADDGEVWKDERLAHLMEANHGHGIRIVHRPEYVKALYSNLSDTVRASIHVKKRVVRIDVSDDGVAVHCDDGTVELGDIVIGADGVHSRTRQAMQSLASGVPSDTDQPSPFTTNFRLLFGNLPALADLPRNTNFECAAEGVSTQILTGEKRAWFAVYEKIEAPTSKRLRWTEDDKAKMLRKWGHLHMATGYTLKDAYEKRIGDVGLINLEEGLLDKWYWRRIVLVGDAVRKLEPHAGLGYNAGVSDLVELVNGLRRLIKTKGRREPPTTDDLEALFKEYQAKRMEETPTIVRSSEKRARMCTWMSPWDRFTAAVLMRYLPLGKYGVYCIMAPIFSRAPVLEWLDEKNLPARAVPYVHHPRTETKEKIEYSNSTKEALPVLPIVTGTVALAALATVGFRLFRR